MAKDSTPTPETNPEEKIAEKHVVEIMGPPQLFDGSKPKPITVFEPTETPAEQPPKLPDAEPAPEEAATESAETMPPSAPEAPAQTQETDIEKINQQLRAQNEGITAESDLDMERPPSDFRATTAPDDAETAAAVDDILKSDAEAVLPGAPHAKAVVMKPSIFERCKNAWFNWWYSPWKRYGTLGVLVLLLALGYFVTPLRTLILNTAGVRSSLQVQVVDASTKLPLQNAVVRVDGLSGKSDGEGRVKLKGIRLGKHDVVVSKVAFAPTQKKQVAFGMRIVDLGELSLKPTGQQIVYNLTDYLSGKAIKDAVVSSGEATAKSDKNGKATLTTEPGSTDTVTITKDGYRTETFERPDPAKTVVAQKLVPSAPAIFISKESGKFDVYKMYLDGKNREVLLAGTGLENQAIAILPNAAGTKVAVASTRDDKRNKDGYLLTALNIVDTASGDMVNLEYAEQIMFLDWRGDTLVYQQTVAGASAANPSRQKIIAYDLAANKRFQLANANYFAGHQLIGSTLYYTVSATDPAAQETFARVTVDGTGKKTLFTGSAWSLLRTDYNKLKIQTPDKWYEYTVGASAPVESTPVSDYTSRYYVDSPDAKHSVRVDARDTKGVLLLRNLADGKETELTTQKSLQAPSYWLSSSVIVYRVTGPTEVADYAISLDGGAPKKIADVSLTGVR